MTEEQNPLVSIIVRTKDRPKLLQRALQSIAVQTLRPVEVVLVNDGGCELAVEDLKDILNDVSLNYIRLEKNTGRAHAGNVGIENAKGKYVGFLDDDDEYYPNHLATLVLFLEQSDYKVAYTDSLMVYQEYDPCTFELINNDMKKEIAFSEDFEYDRLLFGNYIPFMCLLFEGETLRSSGGLDTSFEIYEDWEMLIRIGEKYPFYHIRQVTANYNQWSIHFQVSQRNKDDSSLRQAHVKVLAKHIEKITASRIHNYMLDYVHVRHRLEELRNEHETVKGRVQEKDSEIDALRAELKGREAQLARLYAERKEKDPLVEKLYAELRESDVQIDTLRAELRERELRIDALSSAEREKKLQVNALSADLRERELRIDALNAEVRERDSRLIQLKSELKERILNAENLNAVIKGKDVRIMALQSETREKDILIKAMRDTLGWRILEKYRRTRNRVLLPLNNIKGRGGIIQRGLNVLKNEGITALIQKANKRVLFNRTVRKPPNLYTPADISRISCGGIETSIRSKVSVIIPTKNAGEGFEYTLRRIRQQEGIGETEVIIVDSGSEDGTLGVSESYTHNVFRIPPRSFHHADTRNLGAGKATGDYLVFMVQDAIPIGNQWLQKLLLPLQQGIVSAVTTRQIPRSDADLFASWSYWAHYKYLGYDRDYVHDGSLVTRFDDLDVKTKRVIAGLDSVCLGIKKTVFDTYRFLSNYAEDLELGIRLIKGGHALMFQSSNAVIHSHNRPPMYFLKRSYVDTVSLSEILMFARNDVPSEIILESLAYVYSTLKSCISKIITEDELWKRADFLVHALLEGMVNGINHFDPAWCSLRGDSFLDGFFENISPKNHPDISSEVLSILRGSLLSFLEFFSSYSPADMKEEVQNSFYKFFANAAGHYLGVTTSDRNCFLCESI